MQQSTDLSKGFLVAIEGLDRSGKSTQIEKLKSWLQQNHQSQGQSTTVIRFPSKPSPLFPAF